MLEHHELIVPPPFLWRSENFGLFLNKMTWETPTSHQSIVKIERPTHEFVDELEKWLTENYGYRSESTWTTRHQSLHKYRAFYSEPDGGCLGYENLSHDSTFVFIMKPQIAIHLRLRFAS